jgi:hypothetical protein
MATTTLSKEEWARLERLFSNAVIAYQSFEIDGYKVKVLQQLVGRKLCICCYVNGEVRGEWFTQDCEIQRRFFPVSEIALYRPKAKAEIQRVFNKKEIKRLYPDFDKKIKRPRVTFSSIREVRRVFEANNESIKLIE